MASIDANPPPPETSKFRLGSLTYLLWTAIILAFYILSPGPVMKFSHGRIPKVMEYCYYPLDALYQKVPVVESFYGWYFKLWGIRNE